MLSIDLKEIFKRPRSNFQRLKLQCLKLKYTWINNRLNTVKEKINELENMVIESIKNETERKKKRLRMKVKRASGQPQSCGTTSDNQLYIIAVLQRRRQKNLKK